MIIENENLHREDSSMTQTNWFTHAELELLRDALSCFEHEGFPNTWNADMDEDDFANLIVSVEEKISALLEDI